MIKVETFITYILHSRHVLSVGLYNSPCWNAYSLRVLNTRMTPVFWILSSTLLVSRLSFTLDANHVVRILFISPLSQINVFDSCCCFLMRPRHFALVLRYYIVFAYMHCKKCSLVVFLSYVYLQSLSNCCPKFSTNSVSQYF